MAPSLCPVCPPDPPVPAEPPGTCCNSECADNKPSTVNYRPKEPFIEKKATNQATSPTTTKLPASVSKKRGK